MMLFHRCIACLVFVLLSTDAYSQQEDEEVQAAAIAKRFLSILEKNPQRGTALEKVFSHHLQRGTLDSFIGELEQRTKANASDGVAWMLLGLFESQRRMDTQAIYAFAEAEKLRPDDGLPAYYRGQCLLRTGEPTKAIDAFEIAIQRKPPRIVLLEIFEQLGRTHQRQNRNDLAIEVWKRLESLFPDDLRVLEQIATIQSQESAFQDALPRYERLITLTKDAYQRTQFRMEAAQLRIKLGANDKGMAELDSILGDLKPDGWLYRDVQRKIEEVYLKSNDQAGLISYYENRLEKYPDDIESMVRLSKFLASSGQVPEANQWMAHAIQRAPSRIDLRKTYIDLLVADQQFSAAAEQYGQLSKLDPTNADILRDWGKMVLRDPSRNLEEAKREASSIWGKSLENRSQDALAHIQVADLLQAAQIPDEAQKLFERAIKLAPEESQYREYLGEFLFQQNRREQAFAVWESIAEGVRRNADSVMRLAEIYDHAQQFNRAAVLASEACRLAPRDSSVFVRTARFQKKADQIDQALESLVTADKLADSDDSREFVIQERMEILEASNRLKSETENLQNQLRQAKVPQVAQCQLLARYLVRQKRWKEAGSAVNEALKLDEKNLSMLLLSSEIAEGMGDAKQSIVSLRKLADVDRRRRQEYLERIAKQQIRQRNFAEAIETAKEVVQAVPSKIEGYEFLAQVYTQAKKPDLAIEALRKALRMDPNSSRLTLSLGSALNEIKNYNEAIELYWQAFAKANTLDDKVDLIVKMVKSYQHQNAIPALIDRLEAGRKDPSQRRDLTICLAQVHQSVSDFTSAKRTMEELLTDRTRDTNILKQLARLSLSAGDLEMAIDYQRQLVAFVPGQENESYLASLLRQNGDWNEVNEIVVKLLQNEPDPAAASQNIDALLQRGEYELVLQSLDPMLRKEPENWELLFRRGIAQAGIDQWTQARATFEHLLKLDIERSDSALRRTKQSKRGSSKGASLTRASSEMSTSSDAKLLEVVDRGELADIALGRGRFAVDATQVGTGQKWSPENFGEMRIACIAWLVCCDRKDSAVQSDWLRRVLEQAEGHATRSELIDALAIVKFRQDTNAQIPIETALAMSGEPEMQSHFLDALRRRQISGIATENKNRNPLSAMQIDLMLEAFESAKEEPVVNPSANNLSNAQPMAAVYNAQMASLANRQMAIMIQQQSAGMSNAQRTMTLQSMQRSLSTFNPQMRVPGNFNRRSEGFVRTVVNELRFAGHNEQAEAFLTRQREAADTDFQLASLCEYLLGANRFNDIELPLLRWFELHLKQLEESNAVVTVPLAATASTPSPGSPAEFAVRLLETWGEHTTTESAIRILDSVLAASNQQFRRRQFPTLSAWSLTWGQSPAMQVPVMQVSSTLQTWCTSFFSDEQQKVALSVKALFDQSDRSADWRNYMQARLERSDASLRPLEQLRYALTVDDPSLPNSVPTRAHEAMELIGQEPDCALHAAAALLTLKKFQESRKIAEALSPSNSQNSLLRELIILHASNGLVDKPRMEASLNALETQKLDNITLQSISGIVQQANVMGIASTSRMLPYPTTRTAVAAPRSTPKPMLSQEAVRIKEMNEYVKNGNSAEATKIARQMVSKPRKFSPLVSNNTRVINGQVITRTSNAQGVPSTAFQTKPNAVYAADGFRTSAFEVLKNNGELEKLITETEHRISNSPTSFVLFEQLAEYHEVAGNLAAAEKAMVQALQLRPSASPMRIHLAQMLKKSSVNEACDQYIELLRRDPNTGLLKIAELQAWFESSGRSTDLLKTIQTIHFQAVSKRIEVLSMASTLIHSPNGFEIGATLLEKLVDLDPLLRQQSLQLLYPTGSRPYPRFLSFTMDALIPNENEAIIDPWFGLRAQNPNYQQGSDMLLFELLLRNHSREDVSQKLEPAIQTAIQRMPGWLAGKMMLAMIAARTDRAVEAKQHFAELAPIKRLHIGCPEGVAWRLANEFSELPETRAAAIRLLDTLIGSYAFMLVSPDQQPVMMLTKLWIAEGQRGKAIELLTREYESGREASMAFPIGQGYASGQQGSPSGQSNSNTIVTLADRMLTLSLPVESYRLFERNHSLSPMNPTAGVGQNSRKVTTREAGKRAAITLLETFPADKAVFELLQDRITRDQPALELMLQVPMAKETPSQWIESVLQKTLIQHAKANSLAEIEKGLSKLAVLHPTDVTVRATLARIRLATGQGDAETAMRDTERIAATFDLELEKWIAIAQSPSTPIQIPDFAQPIVSTWLVAKQCYIAGKHLEAAERLATRALNAARLIDAGTTTSLNREERSNRSVPNGYPGPFPSSSINSSTRNNSPSPESPPEAELANVMLLEWGRVQIQHGRVKQGGARWLELVDRIASANAIGSKANHLKQSQFEWLMRVANLAVDEGQVDISKKIIATTIKCKLPPQGNARTVSFGIEYQSAREASGKTAVHAILTVMQRWGDSSTSANERYEFLLGQLLPDERDVFLYADEARLLHLLHEQPTSLGEKLVDYAAQSNRLNELESLMDQRANTLDCMILKTQIAIAKKDFAGAKVRLGKLYDLYQTEKSIAVLKTVCQVAIPAFRVVEMREAALPILNALLEREKSNGNYPEIDFKLFPLVREVDDYLRSRTKAQLSQP